MMQKYTDDPIKQCPKCFENTVVKLLSASGFQLKGSGWYATDFKGKKTEDSSTKETALADKSASSDTSKEATPIKTASPQKSDKGDKA